MSPSGVDLYVSGVEHALLHLLYARFWHKGVLRLWRHRQPDPSGRLFNQGYILTDAFSDAHGRYGADRRGRPRARRLPRKPVTRPAGRIGKSLAHFDRPVGGRRAAGQPPWLPPSQEVASLIIVPGKIVSIVLR